MITDPLFLLTAFAAVVLLGLSKGGFAGIGMAATPLVALVLPPFQAAALLLPILLVQDAISIYVYRREWSAWNLKVMLPGAALGIGVAWGVATHVSDAFVRFVIGLIGVSFVLHTWIGQWRRRGATRAKQPNVFQGVFWGSVSGFTSTFSQAGGPPFQIYVLPQQLPKFELVGTTAIYFGVVNLLKIAPYGALGQFTTENLVTSAALMPLAIAANFLGIWLVKRTPTDLFYKIAYLLVFAISAELLRSGGLGLWRG